MSTLDKSAEVIRTWQQRHKNVMDSNPDWAAQNLAGDLKQAGLLAPERMIPYPRPPKGVHRPAWGLRDAEDDYSRSWVSALGKKIWITDSHGWGKSMTISQARDLVSALLSAINHAEGA